MTGRLSTSRAALLSGTALALLLLGGPATAFDGHGHVPPPTIHTPPPAPPSIYAPPKLPPDSQAIPSRKPRATTPRQPTTTAPRPTPAPTPAPKSAAQTARDKAAAEARAKDRETKESLQEWLTELGYNPGGIDGIVGPKTMDAVFRWVAEIPNAEKQQEARVAAHNGDYEALADMLYIQMVNPDAYAADGGGTTGGVAVQSPATQQQPTQQQPDQQQPTTQPSAPQQTAQPSQPQQAVPPATPDQPGKDATAGFTSRPEPAEAEVDTAADAAPDTDAAADNQTEDAPSEDAQTAAVNPQPEPADPGPVEKYFVLSDDLSDPERIAIESAKFLMQYVVMAKPPSATYYDDTPYYFETMHNRGINFNWANPRISFENWQQHFDEITQSFERNESRIALMRTESQNQLAFQKERLEQNIARKIESDISFKRYANENIEMYKGLIAEKNDRIQGVHDLVARVTSDSEYWRNYKRKAPGIIRRHQEEKERYQAQIDELVTQIAERSATETETIKSLRESIVKWELWLKQLDSIQSEFRTAYANLTSYNSGETENLVAIEAAKPEPEAEAPTAEQLAAIQSAEAERQEIVSQLQQEMDNALSNKMQAEDELASINARTDLPAEESARIAEGIKARMAFNDALLRDTQAKLEAKEATFDGLDGKAGLEFDPYKLTQTDVELTRIADEQKASERFFDELRQARETIRDTAEGLDAAELQDRVTTLSERLAENADEINQLADDLDQYGKNIRVTREQGELEYMAAMAEDAVVAAEENLAYTESVYKTARNAEVALLLIAAGGAATGLGGLTAAEAAAAQGIMAGFEGTTGAIEGYDQGGIVEGLKKGGLEAGKYYLPINTVMAVNRGDDKTGVALGVLSDAAILFTGYKAARANLDKAQAAQAAVTRQALTPAEKAVSQAARQAADKGDDLIATYQKAKWNAQQARAAGVADEVAETTLQQAVKAIDRSDEAKLALKARDPKLQYQFVQDQAKIVKAPAQTAFERNMRARGWSEEAIKTAQIRNQASAGTVGLDDDIRLLEPSVLDKLDDGTPRYSGPNDPRLATDKAAFRKSLTRNGETATLAQWEDDAAAAMDDAYRETVGYSADEARVNMTTSIHEEAYSDVGLLTGQPGSAGWAQQTASVTRVKIADGIEAAEAMGLGGGTNRLSGMALERAATETKVAARELLKDLAGKAMRARPDAALTPKVQKQLRILDGLARGIHDPAVANRLLIEQTGANLPGTLETLSEQVEVLLKF